VVARAAVQLAEGDEAAAAATILAGVAAHGLDIGLDRRSWRHGLALIYVLDPATREHWDSAPLRGQLAVARRLAGAVAAIRDGDARALLRTLELPALSEVRALLPQPFAVELALALEAFGRSEGAALLEQLGPRGRKAVRELASGRSAQGKQARALLAAVPAPPTAITQLDVLGTLRMSRDGIEVTDPDLRRERVRTLVAFLVSNRATTRMAITAALWPDLDDRSAGNNLRVTFTYLLRVLEPGRAAGESSFLVRLDGQRVNLVAGEWLRIDVDAFDEHVEAAARAEADGTPSVALEHNLAVVDLYRGELHAELAEADWFGLDREYYRSRFVAAASRAGQLLVGRDETDRAESVARRAIAVDPWAEAAYAVLVTVALARGDRTSARRTLEQCLAAMADLGVEPAPETQRLRRRLRS
jgi:DNA-binding SARP family transcriptional activator